MLLKEFSYLKVQSTLEWTVHNRKIIRGRWNMASYAFYVVSLEIFVKMFMLFYVWLDSPLP
jgi:hypothetical protein